MFALISLLRMEAVARWILGDVDVVDVTGRTGELDGFLGTLVSAHTSSFQDEELLVCRSMVYDMEVLGRLGTESS